MMKAPTVLFSLLALLATPAVRSAEKPLLRSNDKVVLLGNTLVERARLFGHLEFALEIAAGPEVEGLTFRNLGWSADSVFSDSRSYFGPPQEGRDRLATNLKEIGPNIIFMCYGTGEAMSVDQGWTDEKSASEKSAAGLETSLSLFIEGYQDLIDLVRESGGDPLRKLVLVSPPPLENLGDYLPDQSSNNQNLAAFRDAIRKLAKKNNARFVDLFGALGGDEFDGSVAKSPLTNNGVHYSEAGYQVLGRELVKQLGYDESALANLDSESTENLREAIIEKNRLFFHRWRPANETYLFLFRKHEQGQNAKEIPMFDPLISEQEKRIAEARSAVFSGKTKP